MDTVERRRNEEVEFINTRGEISFAQLKERFSEVSDMTLRTDLKQLDEARRIIRIHGGAKSVDRVIGNDDVLQTRSVRHVEEKRTIARKAAAIIRPHTSVFIDSGSTTTELARIFPDQENVIYTCSLSAAAELSNLKKPQVFLPGGRLNPNSLSISGSAGERELSFVNFDLSFIGVTGYTKTSGFNSGSEGDTNLKRTAISRSARNVVLMDASKLGVTSTYTICDLKDVDVIIADGRLPEDFLSLCRQANVKVL